MRRQAAFGTVTSVEAMDEEDKLLRASERTSLSAWRAELMTLEERKVPRELGKNIVVHEQK